MVQELKKRGLFDSTMIIISAKHGQSPIDPSKLRTLKTNPGISTRPSDLLAGDAPMVTEDDIALVWLQNPVILASDLTLLENKLTTANIQKILAAESLKLVFNDPSQDSRTRTSSFSRSWGRSIPRALRKLPSTEDSARMTLTWPCSFPHRTLKPKRSSRRSRQCRLLPRFCRRSG